MRIVALLLMCAACAPAFRIQPPKEEVEEALVGAEAAALYPLVPWLTALAILFAMVVMDGIKPRSLSVTDLARFDSIWLV